MTTITESSFLFWSLVAAVAVAPLPFGAVHEWSFGLIACVVAVLMAAWALLVISCGTTPHFGLRRLWPIALPFGLVVAWILFQAFGPTPATWHHPFWQEADRALGTPVQGWISIDPESTLSALTHLLTYAVVFTLAMQLCRRATRARQAVWAIAIAGMAYASYGIVAEVSGADMVLWRPKPAYHGDLTSTFINRNNFATYGGLALLCVSGLLWDSARRALAGAGGGRERLRRLLDDFGRRGWVLLAGWVVIAMAILMTHSRGGLISTAAGLAALSVTLGLTRETRPKYAIAGAVVAALAASAAFTLGGETTDVRLAQALSWGDERPHVYALTIQAIEATPWRGTGYGTFAQVFEAHRDAGLANFYLKAHNTYLENALELGIPAALLLFGAVAGLAAIAWRGARRRRRDAVFPCIGVAATVLVGVHALVDFSWQIPAVALTWCLIMGAACAQSWSSTRPADPW